MSWRLNRVFSSRDCPPVMIFSGTISSVSLVRRHTASIPDGRRTDTVTKNRPSSAGSSRGTGPPSLGVTVTSGSTARA